MTVIMYEVRISFLASQGYMHSDKSILQCVEKKANECLSVVGL